MAFDGGFVNLKFELDNNVFTTTVKSQSNQDKALSPTEYKVFIIYDKKIVKTTSKLIRFKKLNGPFCFQCECKAFKYICKHCASVIITFKF